MGDFFAPPPGFPEVPIEPATPPPSFESIGEGLWAGATKAAGTGGLLGGLFDTLVRWFTAIIGFLLQYSIKLVAWLINLLTNVENDAAASYGVLVAATLRNLLNVNVDPSQVSTRTGGPGRQAAATALGQAVLSPIYSNVPAATGNGVPPGHTAADQYLANVMNMELNGWIESWFTDAGSYHLLEKFGDLKDGISRVLGLGRMSRQVFAPPLKVLVHDPYLAELNAKFRPKLVDAGTAIQAFLRAEFDRDQLSALLAPAGYTEAEIDWLVRQHTKYLSVDDVNYLLARGIWQTSDAITYLGFQGWSPADAQHLLDIAADKELQAYRKQAIAAAEASFVAGDLDAGTWQSLVSGSGLTQVEQSWTLSVANVKRQSKITHLSLGQIETGIKDGVMSFADLQTWATRVNMPADELALLELTIQVQMNKQSASAAAKAAAAKAKADAAAAKTAATAAKAAQAKAAAPDKGVTVAQAESLVKDGLWTFDQLTAFLTNKGYGSDAIASIVELLHASIDKTTTSTAAASTTKATAAAKGLNLATVEKAVVAGVLTIDDLTNWLSGHGFDSTDSQVIVELTQEAVAAAKVKADAKAAATAKASAKQISLPELEHAVRLGLTPLSTYTAALQAAGFDQLDITLLTGILNAQIASDQAAAAKRSGVSAAGAAAHISISQLEQEVINGIRPIGDYTSTLAQLGYSPADQSELTQLLQLKVDGAKLTAAKKAAAGAALDARGISLTQAEQAVKLGVIPITTYQAQLQTAGFTPDAVNVLSNTLLAEVAKTSKAQTAANGAATTLATKGISLPDLEKAVVAGVRPIADYTAALTNAGYSAGDVDTLQQLLQLKVDHAAAAAATHADAEGQATAKGISLGKEEAAVVAGDLTMDDYDALLTQLGYDDVDRAVLEQLLQTKVDAAAAKAGGSAPAPTSGT
jgi:hypothetical protein